MGKTNATTALCEDGSGTVGGSGYATVWEQSIWVIVWRWAGRDTETVVIVCVRSLSPYLASFARANPHFNEFAEGT